MLLLGGCRSKEAEERKRAPAKIRELPANAPRLAIIIDDMGYDHAAAENLFTLQYPLTCSVLPHLPASGQVAEEAHRRGYQVMLHLPMEAEGGEAKQEAIFLHAGLSVRQTDQTLSDMLATVPYVVGVNNHQGSRATADAALMSELMPLLHRRKLFFIDSRTTVSSRAYTAAREAGVPTAYRRVFLDDVPTREAVLRQLDLAAEDAQRNGWSIAIGHPHPVTIEALRYFLPQAHLRGIRLVFVSELVR